MVDRLTDLERQKFGKASLLGEYHGDSLHLRGLQRSLRLKRAAGPLPVKLWQGRFVLRTGEDLEGYTTTGSLFAISGNIEVSNVLHSVFLAGGSVNVRPAIFHSLVVCDGDFSAQLTISNSLIIARGKVRCDGEVENSRIICGGKVQFKHPERVRGSKVVENERKPLDFITFFDPAEAGITVASADGGVRVKAAAKGKPFAKAGLLADDLITALDGTAVKDAEGFRRLLRATLAVAGMTTFKIRRGDKALDIPVPHKD